MKQGWIQIGSGLPNEGQQVMVWDADINLVCMARYVMGKWRVCFEEHFEYPGVTHWMPAPEKPKTARK